MNANTPNTMTRRSFLTASAAGAFTVPSVFATQSSPLFIDDDENASVESGFDESFTAVDDMFEVEWDSKLWSEYEPDGPSSDGVIRLWNRDKKDRWDPGYTLKVSYQRIAWGTETVEEAIDNWFTLGMLGSVILDTWDDDDEMGFIFNSGTWEANTRTLMVFIYRPIAGQPERRLWSTMVYDQVIFDADHVRELLGGFSIDGGPFTQKYSDDDLVSFLEANLD